MTLETQERQSRSDPQYAKKESQGRDQDHRSVR